MTGPTLTVVIGANGAGKSTWCRQHRNELPQNFYDADSIAEELGSYDDPDDQLAARDFVDARIASHFENRETFGFESTYSGNSRPKAVRDAVELRLPRIARVLSVGTHTPGHHDIRTGRRGAANARRAPFPTLAGGRQGFPQASTVSIRSAILADHSLGPAICTDSPRASTETVTGMSRTSNSSIASMPRSSNASRRACTIAFETR